MSSDIYIRVTTTERIRRTYTVPLRPDEDYRDVVWLRANAVDADELLDGDERVEGVD